MKSNIIFQVLNITTTRWKPIYTHNNIEIDHF